MVLILEEFSTVQEEADKIDNMLNTLSVQVRGPIYSMLPQYRRRRKR